MTRPVPHPTPETRPFWEGCASGELRYQACTRCAAVQGIPRTLCPRCQGTRFEWHRATGLGRVFSHTTVHRAPVAAFRADVPYVIALVDFDEGFRLMVNVRGGDEADVRIGARVRVAFRQVDGMALPEVEVFE